MGPTTVPASSDLSLQFATAYYNAAQAGAEMRIVANTLETLRDQLGKATEPYAIWAALDEQIGRADLDRFVPALVKLRDEFQSAVISAQVAHLKKVFAEDSEKGWTEWLSAYSRSFDNTGWRVLYAAAIAQGALSYSPHPDWTVQRIRESAGAICGARWPEAYDWLLFLASLELPVEHRAKFFAIAGEIQIFHFCQFTKAKALLEKAHELAPDELQVRNAWGEYWTERRNWERAREVFHQLVEAYPKYPGGYVGLGNCDEKTGQLASAEAQYYQAVLSAPGYETGYERLTLLLLRPDQQKEKVDPTKLESLIQPFLQRWRALADEPALAFVSVGESYKNRKDFKEARRYFQDVIQVNASYTRRAWLGYAWLGYTDMDEALQVGTDSAAASRLYSSAKENFTTTIKLAPGALDGYWGLSGLYLQQQNWIEAEEWTNRCLNVHREWESFVLVRRAEILRRQGRLQESEEVLFRILSIESANQAALDIMSFLLDDYHTKGEKEVARRLLDEWVRLSEPASAYVYHNTLGNWSYEAGDYASAAEAYRRAVEAKDADAVLHSNLARAIEKLRVTGQRLQELQEAIAELQRANELQPQPDYEERLAVMRSEEAFLKVYGEAAAAFDPVVDPIRADIDSLVAPELLVAATGDLSSATKTAVQAARSRLKQKFGFTLPGVKFRDFQPPGSGKYSITINELTSYEGSVKGGLVCSTVVSHLEQAVQNHMAEFLGHDDVTWLLEKSNAPAAQAIVQDTTRLTDLVGLLKEKLAGRESIEHIEAICEDFLQGSYCKNAEPTAIHNDSTATLILGHNGFPQVTVRIGQTDQLDRTALEYDLRSLPTALFNDLGIAVPPINFEHDATLSERSAVLVLNQKEITTMQDVDSTAIYISIQSCAADLMVPELTEYYLAKLKAYFPVLIRAVYAQLDIQKVTIYLKSRLRKRLSIKNLQGVLEDQLQDTESDDAGWQAATGNV